MTVERECHSPHPPPYSSVSYVHSIDHSFPRDVWRDLSVCVSGKAYWETKKAVLKKQKAAIAKTADGPYAATLAQFGY